MNRIRLLNQNFRAIFHDVLERGVLVFSLWMLLAIASQAQQVIPAARTFPEAWQNAGHPGGNPVQNRTVNVRDFGALGDNSTDDRAAFTNAITSLAGNPGVVYVPPGNYRIKAALNIPSGVVLRGHSAAETTLTFDFSGDAVLFKGKESGSWASFTAPVTMHESTLTISNTAPYPVGTYALLTQTDDPAWNITDSWGNGSAGQIVKIASVNGNQLQTERPLRHDYPLDRSPKMRPLTPVRNSGMENLTLTRILVGDPTSRNNKATVRFIYAVDCWMRGVHANMAFGSHVSVDYSSRVEITGCYLDDAHEFDGGGSGYGVIFQFRSGECLVQNNIFRRLRHAMIMQAGPNGNVVAYNYSREGNSSDHSGYVGDMCLHGNYPYANLFEGNIGGHIWIDNSHNGANGPFNTFFRNRAQQAGFNISDTRAHQQNVVGNELFKASGLGSIIAGNGYSFKGTNHFTYGNNSKASGLQPAGTGNLADYSYYLNSDPTVPPPTPAWWTITNTLPTIGAPLAFDPPAKTNPASARWDAAQQLTVRAPVPILAPPTVLQLTEGTNTSVPLAITNAGAGMLNWILTSISYGPGASNWITSVSPTNGLVKSPPGSTTVTVNRSALGPTPSTATLYFQSNGGPAQVTVVASELPPLFITNAPVPIPKTWFEQHGITENMEEAALADLDGDSVPTWKEYLADTDPTHANSVFRADHFETNNGGPWTLHFSPSSPNRIYTLQKSADLHLGPWLNVPGQGPRQGTGGADSMILPAPTGAREFYRMTVGLPE